MNRVKTRKLESNVGLPFVGRDESIRKTKKAADDASAPRRRG